VPQRRTATPGDGPDRIRLYLYHPYHLALIGLRSVLAATPWIDVVGEGGSRRLLARRVRECRADLVLVGLSGDAGTAELDAVRAISALDTDPAPRVIVLSQDHEPDTVLAAVRVGAQAFLSPEASAPELQHAVRVVADGGAVLCPCGAKAVIDAYVGGEVPAAPTAHDDLSHRERQVLRLLAMGGSSAEVAARLGVTETTVRSHVHHLLGKLGLSSRAQAIAYAFRHGIVAGVPVRSAGQPLDHLGHAGHRRHVEHGLQRHLHA
jgi:DNA-binding NarL/FixJ family response regulator